MLDEFYLGRFVESHCPGLILTALVIEMLVSPAADYHPHFGGVLAAFVWLVVVAAAIYMASRQLARWPGCGGLPRLLEAFRGPDHSYSHPAPLAELALSCSTLWGIVERAHRVPRSPGTALAESFIAYLVIASPPWR